MRWTRDRSFGAGTYVFTVRADDGVRLWLDDVLVIDQWKDQGPTTYNVTKDLASGIHAVKMEYYERGGGAVAELRWVQAP